MYKLIGRALASSANLHHFIIKQAPKFQRYSTHINKTIKLTSNQSELTTSFQESCLTLDYKVTSSNQYLKKLPYVWLRNNCKCPKCYDEVTEENELDLSQTPVDIKPSHVEQNSEKESFEITWEDGHKSVYNQNHLYQYVFRNDLYKLNATSSQFLWNRQSLASTIPSVEYNAYVSDDAVVKLALQSLIRYGFVMVKNVPEEPKEIVRVCTRIAPIQDSIFGQGEVMCTNQFGFTDRAYTNAKLKAHTDNIYIKNSAG